MRRLRSDELVLVSRLIALANRLEEPTALSVCEMNDGGMGSLLIGVDSPGRKFEKTIAECSFFDSDQVAVLACLTIDQENSLFEVDIWKTDFSVLQQFPLDSEIMDGPFQSCK